MSAAATDPPYTVVAGVSVTSKSSAALAWAAARKPHDGGEQLQGHSQNGHTECDGMALRLGDPAQLEGGERHGGDGQREETRRQGVAMGRSTTRVAPSLVGGVGAASGAVHCK